jgi:hypothetical protein
MANYWKQDAVRAANRSSLKRSVLRGQMLSELKARVQWLEEQDPKQTCPKMQGARYAYLTYAKWIRKNL